MTRRDNLKVGLTGGMGCGKSTAAAMFAQRGFERHDADAFIRDELYRRPAVVEAVTARFGPDVLNENGEIRRDRVAGIVFTDPAGLEWLENLLHPLVYRHWRGILEQRSGGNALIFEVPLLFEKGLQNWFDFTVCVTTDSNTQMQRLERRGISPMLARQRLAKQFSLARKCELADFVLLNDGPTEFLKRQVNELADRLLKPSEHRRPIPAP